MPGSEDDLRSPGRARASYDEEPERSAELRHVRAGDVRDRRRPLRRLLLRRGARPAPHGGGARRRAARPWRRSGPIIHNPSVVGHLKDRGVDVVDEVDDATAGTLIVRTHGVSPDVIEHARSRHLNVVDATCPFVSVAQRKAAACARRATPS